MILSKIRWQNLLSYGNYITEVDLLKDNLTVVVGSNGVGKSTLLDALCFVLFGRAFRNINKPLLVNSITKKELLVEIELNVSGMNYRIVRGIKPAIFEIWFASNGVGELVKQDMTGVRDEQAALEEILGCNFKTFCQVVCLGADYEPFLKLDKAARRKVVENLLDLEVFSQMNMLLKEDYGTVVDTLKALEAERSVIREKANAWSSALAASSDLKRDRIEQYEREIEGLLSEKKAFSEDAALLEFISPEEYEACIGKMKKYETEFNNWRTRGVECDQHIRRVENELKFFRDHATCPTCQQTIDAEFVKNMVEDKDKQLDRYKDAKVKIKDEEALSFNLLRLNTILRDKQMYSSSQLTIFGNQMSKIDLDIRRVNNKIEDEKIEHEFVKQEVIDELNDNLSAIDQNMAKLFAEKATLTPIGKMLKDDGIKAVVISSYITKINELINKFLVEMDLFVNLYLDGEFNETIKSRYRDEFRYDSFSEGQKMRIDLAILFAWREIAKQRNSLSVNLLVFDEVLSGSLDAEGIVDLIKILEGRFQENIFLITHDDRITSRFANVINVSQDGGFSRMAVKEADDK